MRARTRERDSPNIESLAVTDSDFDSITNPLSERNEVDEPVENGAIPSSLTWLA